MDSSENDDSGGRVVFDISQGLLAIIPAGGAQRDTYDILHHSVKHFADDPFQRNFVISCTDVFVAAQKAFQESLPDPVPQKTATSLSQMYRGFLLELIGNLNSAGDIETATLYTNLEFVWHFCEIMFISSHPDLPILPYLIDWVKVNFDETAHIMSEIDFSDLEPESKKKIWNLIVTQILHGQTEQAAKLLPFMHTVSNGSRNHVEEEQLQIMVELLNTKPKFLPSETSVTEFESSWHQWREVCDSRLKDKTFFGHEKLTFVCNILIGHENAFKEVLEQEYIRSWYEYLVMTIDYRFPTIRPSAVKGFARKTIEDVCATEELSPKDNMLLFAMDYDIVNVLKEVQAHWHHPWFALHFSDLIFGGGQFSNVADVRIDYSSVGPMRDHFILDYGTMLMEHSTLWLTGFKYFEATSDETGKSFIREFLQRKKPKSENEAYKLIMIAEKCSFGVEIHGICKEMALSKLRLGQLQNALLWAIKAGDGPLTTFIVDEILFDGDCFIEPALMNSLRNAVPCADRLLFLSGYCDFRNLMDKKDYKGAIPLLCQLIRDDLIPKRIAQKILGNIHSLADSKTKLETEHISLLMQFLHSKIGFDNVNEKEFTQLNTLLMCHRAQEIVARFKTSRQKSND